MFLRSCPSCDSLDAQTVFQGNTVDFDQKKFPTDIKIVCCNQCQFTYNNNYPESVYLNYYLNESEYNSSSSFGTGGLSTPDKNRYEIYVQIFEKLNISKNDLIVDIGCGKGGLLSFLQTQNYQNLAGVEIDRRLVEKANELGVNVKKGGIENLPKFDQEINLICVSHLLEHIFELKTAIDQIYKAIGENGFVFIEVPDASMYSEQRVFDSFWLTMREHINHFDPYQMERLFNEQGLNLVYCRQSKVDYNLEVAYPSLMFLFQKTNSITPTYHKSSFPKSLIKHVEAEKAYHIQNTNKIDNILSQKKSLIAWGIGSEFFVNYSHFKLKKGSFKLLIDKNQSKQGLSINNLPIKAPEALSNLTDTKDYIACVFSVLRHTEIHDSLRLLGFEGEIVIFN